MQIYQNVEKTLAQMHSKSNRVGKKVKMKLIHFWLSLKNSKIPNKSKKISKIPKNFNNFKIIQKN